jgi:hypothetical protein
MLRRWGRRGAARSAIETHEHAQHVLITLRLRVLHAGTVQRAA